MVLKGEVRNHKAVHLFKVIRMRTIQKFNEWSRQSFGIILFISLFEWKSKLVKMTSLEMKME